MILNSPYITGSITVTGNANIQGQLTVTGSLSGTAATASFALTLDGTGSVGFATTGAFSATSGSASSRLTQIEQVYATTGSNSFRATQSITGSLTVTGQIIAQTINVQQVTSSIVYSSGSNVFGCDINSRQTFTGSFYQTGSVSAFYSCVGIGTNFPTKALEIFSNVSQDGIKISGASNPRLTIIDTTNSVQFDALTTDTEVVLRSDTNHPLHLSTNGTLRLNIANTGEACFACQVCAPNVSVVNCLGVGTVAGAGYLLDVYQPAGATTAYARIRNNRTRNAALQFETYCANYLVGVGIGTDTNRLMIYDNNAGATRLTLDQCGNVGLATTPAAWVSTARAFQINAYNSIASQHNGSFNIISEAYESAANAFVYGTTGGYPTRINMNPNDGVISIFNAPTGTAGCTVTWCERLRITSEGYLGTTVTGTTVSDGDLLGVLAFVSRDSSTYSSGGITNIRSYATQTYNTGNVAGDMRFYVTNGAQNTTGTYLFGTEAMRITCNGNVVIGNTTAYGGLTVSDFSANDGNDAISLFYRGTSGGHESLIKFYDFRGQVNAAMGNNLEDDGSGTQKARLSFKTSCNGSPVERMRIASNGVVRIGTCAINTNANSNVALQVAGAIRFGNPDGEYVQSYGGGISARSCGGWTPGSTAIIVKGMGGSGFLYQIQGFTGSGKRFTDLVFGINTIVSVIASATEAGPGTRCYTITSENLNLCISGADSYNVIAHGFGAVER